MSVKLQFVVVLCVTAIVTPATLHAEQFRAGVAVTDITPPAGYRMSGYFSERLATGTLDPLQAKAVVFEQGDQRAALVFCDIIGISLDVSNRARAQAAKKTGIPVEHIAVAATHSHTGPLYTGALRKLFHDAAVAETGKDDKESVDYPGLLVQRIVSAIEKAQAAAVPVQLHSGSASETRLSFNRRFHMKGSTVVRFNPGQLNPDILRVAGPIDPDVGIIKLTTKEKALASIVVFALHLDTVGGTKYSADYPGHLQRELRKKYGSDFLSLFGAGTCGDINHVDVTVRGRRPAKEIGTMLAETTRKKLADLRSEPKPSLAVRSAKVNAPLQEYSAERIAKAKENMNLIGTSKLSFLDQVEAYKITAIQSRGKTIPLEVQVFRLSNDVAIVTLPGEVFVDLGLAIKAASPFDLTLVMELTNDAPGYIPTRKAFAEGSYETVNSRIKPGGGEAMVQTAIRLLKELKGDSQ